MVPQHFKRAKHQKGRNERARHECGKAIRPKHVNGSLSGERKRHASRTDAQKYFGAVYYAWLDMHDADTQKKLKQEVAS
jgi:hypothetical protein